METSSKTGFNVQNFFIEVGKELYKEHEEIKNRLSRPGSMTAVSYTPELDNINLGTGEEEEEGNKQRKTKCC